MVSSSPPLESRRKKKRRNSIAGSVAVLSLVTGKLATTSGAHGEATDENENENEERLFMNNQQRLRLYDLPHEILLQIASEICGEATILNLALVDKRFRSITREAMVKKLVIPKNRIKQTIEMLARHPDMMSKINSIDLGAFMSEHTKQCVCYNDTVFNRKARRIFRNTIPFNINGTVTWNHLQKSKRVGVWIWSPKHQFLMALLLSLCPNVKDFTLQLPTGLRFDSSPLQTPTSFFSEPLPTPNPNFRPFTPFQGVALQIMQNNLRSLTIPPFNKWSGPKKHEVLMVTNDVLWKRYGTQVITLKGFNKLKHLNVRMDVLGLPDSIIFQGVDDEDIENVRVNIVTDVYGSVGLNTTAMDLPAKVLPLSLTSLQLRSCTDRAFALLAKINNTPAEKLNLKHIDLFFDLCARSSITQCYKEDRGRLDYLRILSELERKGITVTFITDKSKKITDMRRELEPMYLLSPCEAGLVTLARKQFSELNMVAVRRRISSHTEHKLFIKYLLTHFDLLNSPTFDGNLWKDIGIFRGSQKIKYNTEREDTEVYTKAHLDVKPKRTRRDVVLDLNYFVFSFRSQTVLPSTPRVPQAVEFCGKAFTTSFNSIVIDPTEDIDIEDAEYIHKKTLALLSKKELAKKATKRAAKKVLLEDREDSQPTLSFNGNTTPWLGKRVDFDSGMWSLVDWKFHMQPHIVEMTDR